MTKALALGALLFTACGIDDDQLVEHDLDPTEAPLEEEAGDISPDAVPFGYSSWRLLRTPAGCGIYVRVCKTSTRINWEFTGNADFYRVQTSGNGISAIDSNIDYVWSGSKYRTRAGTTFNWFFDSYRNGCGGVGYGMYISQMPSC